MGSAYMIKTMMPGEGDEFSRQHEVDMLNEMLHQPHLEERRHNGAMPIGRRLLQAEVFGTEEYLAPFEFPEPHFPLRRESVSNN
jgi:hypothetical protein